MYAKLLLNLVTVQDDQKAMANLEARAAKARKMNAHHSTTDVICYLADLDQHGCLQYGLGLFAERNSGDIPFGIAPGEDGPCEQFDPAKIAEYKRLQQGSSGKRSWLACLANVF